MQSLAFPTRLIPSVRIGQPALVLAPMEGVTDAPMRALMTEVGGFSFCVSEFLRISQDVPPARVYYDHVPELRTDCQTAGGLPVQFQLLGGNAERLARAAHLACRLGARGIDLNFGCPAPTVNRHDGGASLLKFPDRIREIVAAVRQAVPTELPVSAKLRLGWDSLDPIHENAERAAEGGASWITIHGRTKVQGYQPPAYWQPIGEVRARLGIPVIANGDIWTLDDFKRCRDETGSQHYMLGRGAMADPALPRAIARELGIAVPESRIPPPSEAIIQAREWLPYIRRFAEISLPYCEKEGYVVRRIKQWGGFARTRKRAPWFEDLKRAEKLTEIFAVLDNPGAAVTSAPQD